jgi:hypothetical protein
VARYLSRLPSGSTVRMHYGAVMVKYVRRWMTAGFIGDPITSTALSRLNGGVRPTLLVPAWAPSEATP